MISVRFHGRGGQGAVIASKLLASALFREGWQVQAFPSFGAERTGAPVMAFLRCDHQPITITARSTSPITSSCSTRSCSRRVDVTAGLARGRLAHREHAARRRRSWSSTATFNVATCDATAIALAHGLGSRTIPIVNTAMVGAFAATTRLVTLDAVLDAIPDYVPLDGRGEPGGGARRVWQDAGARHGARGDTPHGEARPRMRARCRLRSGFRRPCRRHADGGVAAQHARAADRQLADVPAAAT